MKSNNTMIVLLIALKCFAFNIDNTLLHFNEEYFKTVEFYTERFVDVQCNRMMLLRIVTRKFFEHPYLNYLCGGVCWCVRPGIQSEDQNQFFIFKVRTF